MERKQFLKTIATGAIGMTTLAAFRSFTSGLDTLGLKGNKNGVSFFNDKAVGGSLTLTSVKLG